MANCLSFASEFVTLFSEMTPLVIILFVLGIIFCVIELFTPGFGVFGISGIVFIVVAIVLRMIDGGTLSMLLYMLLISGAIVGILFGVVTHSIKKGKLGKTAIFSVKPSVPEGKTEGTQDFSSLVGNDGVAVTALHPVGRASFDGNTVDVVARDGFVEQGKTVTVVAVEGQRVTVIEK